MAQLERDIDACDQKKASLLEDHHDNKLDLDAFPAQRQARSPRQAKLRDDHSLEVRWRFADLFAHAAPESESA